VFGASDLFSDDQVAIPCPHVLPPRRPSAHAAADFADSDDEVPIQHSSPRSALASCDSDDEVLVLHPLLSCLSSTFRPFVQPALQACGHG
jgi:hypothetical protein